MNINSTYTTPLNSMQFVTLQLVEIEVFDCKDHTVHLKFSKTVPYVEMYSFIIM